MLFTRWAVSIGASSAGYAPRGAVNRDGRGGCPSGRSESGSTGPDKVFNNRLGDSDRAAEPDAFKASAGQPAPDRGYRKANTVCCFCYGKKTVHHEKITSFVESSRLISTYYATTKLTGATPSCFKSVLLGEIIIIVSDTPAPHNGVHEAPVRAPAYLTVASGVSRGANGKH